MGSITEFVLSYSKNKALSPDFLFGETTKNKKYPFNNAGNGVRVLETPSGAVKFLVKDQNNPTKRYVRWKYYNSIVGYSNYTR